MSNVEPAVSPFTVLIDTGEQHPFTFCDLETDADQNSRPLIVKTRFYNLGRHPISLGDYSIEGAIGRVGVERKSVEDVQATVLGWPSQYDQDRGNTGRRERFERELYNLSRMDAGIVIIEGSLQDCLESMPEWGKKPAATNAKIFFRSIIAYQQDFVPFLFCDSRYLAEVATYRYLARYWRHYMKGKHECRSQPKRSKKPLADAN